MRISFTDQRLTAHGGMVVWSHFLHESAFRTQLAQGLPPAPKSNHAYDPSDVALGFLGGILSGADKLSRIAYLRQDSAIPQVLGIEAVPSQSTLPAFPRGVSPEQQRGTHRAAPLGGAPAAERA